MAWKMVVLEVLSEYKTVEGVLKSRWEIVRREGEDGKHFSNGYRKSIFYTKDGVQKSFPSDSYSEYDLKWIEENLARIKDCLNKKYESAAPAPVEEKEIPF